ncbi:hypothetical protein [Marinoscillum sp.]|uniref:hypothetical protein n=1 Tax=Marinoscillum sp. TaxID=2024838 RepID=UPI003BAA3F8B
MYTTNIDNEIFTKLKRLNRDQKTDVLDYLEHIPKVSHSTRIYRRKAMKQIREALEKDW